MMADRPNTLDTSADLIYTASRLATGEETLPREDITTGQIGMNSGTMKIAHFTARKSETTTQVRVWCGGTAAGATPTLVRIGLYEIAADGSGVLVASTPNDTALLASSNTAYTKSWSSSYEKKAGRRYAVGILVVTGATAPTVAGDSSSFSDEMIELPVMNAAVTGLADLPATTAAAGSLSTTSGRPYAVVLP